MSEQPPFLEWQRDHWLKSLACVVPKDLILASLPAAIFLYPECLNHFGGMYIPAYVPPSAPGAADRLHR